MHRDNRYDPYGMNGYPFDPTVGSSYGYGTQVPSAFDQSLDRHECPRPFTDVEFQPLDNCPKNFVIFDQTYNNNTVAFHPALPHQFCSANFNMYDNYAQEALNCEVTEDIDALLSSEEIECQDDDDEVSTGRTPIGWGETSPDSSCSYTDGNAGNSASKRVRTKKLVKSLKAIVPGGDRMDTPAVLDEAVKYLKSLKLEVKKLGMRTSDR